jgi:hypothetical protein
VEIKPPLALERKKALIYWVKLEKKFPICRLEIERKILIYCVEIEINFSNTGWR